MRSSSTRPLHKMIVDNLILVAAVCAFSYIVLCLYAFFMGDRLIFPRVTASYSDSSRVTKLETAMGDTITAIHLPNPDARFTIFYSHGNGEDLGRIQWLLEGLYNRGFSVFAYDYPGYGTSTGRPSESGVYAAADAGFSYLTESLGIDPATIILFGRSLGSGPTTKLASEHRVAGVILESAFTSAFRVVTNVRFLPWDVFPNIRRIGTIGSPILLIHGTADSVVPFHHAESLLAAAHSRPTYLWIEGGSHNDLIEFANTLYWQTIEEFAVGL